jgi:hypothetical protein
MLAFRGAGGEPPQALSLWGLTCPAAPAGVSHLPLQSTSLSTVCFSQDLFKNNNLLEKSLYLLEMISIISSVSGKTPVSSFEYIFSPFTVTSKAPPELGISSNF